MAKGKYIRTEKIRKQTSDKLKGIKRTEDFGEKISETLKKKYASGERKASNGFTKGTQKTHSKETRIKLKENHQPQKQSEGTKRKIRENNKGKHFYWLGKTSPRKGKTNKEFYGEERALGLREQNIQHAIQMHTEGRFPQTNTLPHRLLRKAMQENNLWDGFQDEVSFKWGCIDIAKPEKKVAIYVDGNYWHHYPKGNSQDKAHTAYLENRGWKVLRFWESDIRKDVNNCINKIRECA